mmetsp:Transcript_31040/g.72570  ORF Transcript_31040/g.72570 Transcript_31040/m.72570 type:complete len:293 (+) Transcript_31040:4006-4884(+)
MFTRHAWRESYSVVRELCASGVERPVRSYPANGKAAVLPRPLPGRVGPVGAGEARTCAHEASVAARARRTLLLSMQSRDRAVGARCAGNHATHPAGPRRALRPRCCRKCGVTTSIDSRILHRLRRTQPTVRRPYTRCTPLREVEECDRFRARCRAPARSKLSKPIASHAIQHRRMPLLCTLLHQQHRVIAPSREPDDPVHRSAPRQRARDANGCVDRLGEAVVESSKVSLKVSPKAPHRAVVHQQEGVELPGRHGRHAQPPPKGAGEQGRHRVGGGAPRLLHGRPLRPALPP